jgi:hypothetical protein
MQVGFDISQHRHVDRSELRGLVTRFDAGRVVEAAS